MRDVTRNEGRTDSEAELWRDRRTIETRFQVQKEVGEGKAQLFFPCAGYFLPLCQRQKIVSPCAHNLGACTRAKSESLCDLTD